VNGQGTHFWYMSFLVRNGRELRAEERSGHWTPSIKLSRFDAMNEIRRQVVEASPYLADAVMLSCDIQRNELPW
jgi:hypothetical protein